MKFDDWWETLTIKEQTVIGKNNAKYVWECSASEERKNISTLIANMPGDTAASIAIYVREL